PRASRRGSVVILPARACWVSWRVEPKQLRDRTRDHQFLVRGDDADLHATAGAGNHRRIPRVAPRVQAQSQKIEAVAYPRADGGCMFAHATGEDEGVHT